MTVAPYGWCAPVKRTLASTHGGGRVRTEDRCGVAGNLRAAEQWAPGLAAGDALEMHSLGPRLALLSGSLAVGCKPLGRWGWGAVAEAGAHSGLRGPAVGSPGVKQTQPPAAELLRLHKEGLLDVQTDP